MALAARASFSSLILLNLAMFSLKLGLFKRVMKSLAFLLSPLLPLTETVLVSILLKLA